MSLANLKVSFVISWEIQLALPRVIVVSWVRGARSKSCVDVQLSSLPISIRRKNFTLSYLEESLTLICGISMIVLDLQSGKRNITRFIFIYLNSHRLE